MKLSRIHHIAIIASNYEQAKEFYVDKLGFELIRETKRANDWKIDLRVDDETQIELFVKSDAPDRSSYPEACGLRHLAFKVDDVEKAVVALKEIGIVSEPIRKDSITAEKMTFFHDPDGLPIEIHE